MAEPSAEPSKAKLATEGVTTGGVPITGKRAEGVTGKARDGDEVPVRIELRKAAAAASAVAEGLKEVGTIGPAAEERKP